MKIEVLYEDEHILVVSKPSGLLVHPSGKGGEKTLCDFLTKRYPGIENVGEPLKLPNGKVIPRPGIIHRLDRDTSGVLLAAKDDKAFKNLKKQFKSRTIKKIYNAFVYGKVKDKQGSINLPLGRSKGDFRQYTTPIHARGEMREALTYFKVLEEAKDFSFLELIPKTGRTHQLRAHLKAVHHPIVCDRLYAPKKPCALGFNRVALHARAITFKNLKGKEIIVEAPIPRDFKKALTLLKD